MTASFYARITLYSTLAGLASLITIATWLFVESRVDLLLVLLGR